MNTEIKGILLTLLAAASFGAVAPIAKFIYQYEITPNFMLALRFLIASLFLWGYIFINRKKINYKLEKDQMIIMLLIGAFIYFLTTIFYFNAIKFIPVSLHVMIFYSYPFMVNIFSFFVFKEKISKNQSMAMIIAFVGLVLTVSINSSGFSILGISLSLLAAIFNGTYILLLGTIKINRVDSVVTAAYTNLFSSISFFIYCGIKGEIHVDMPSNAWIAIVFIAIISTAIAIISLSKGIRMIGASKASIISTFEPLEGVILSFIFLGESMNIKQIIGIALIVFAIFLINIPSTKESNTQNAYNEKIL
ncbi:DMT family transporter [Clostridium sp. PL3]|uniref:DMT family transporter n=1 Tax=Clostridium thailandense TaxID=2794346 RepID=A0A949TYV2_9CLOT|nr:DMT family transporter [Clostridium thailandense]MBV7276161.1 DMT family transporter [Clostridium thailandense]